VIRILVRLKDDTSIRVARGRLFVSRPGQPSLAIPAPPPAVVKALRSLSTRPERIDAIGSRLIGSSGADALLRWIHLTDTCRTANVLEYVVSVDGRPLAVVEPLSPGVAPRARDLTRSAPRDSTLSRFAYLRREAADLVLDCPESQARIRCPIRIAAALLRMLDGASGDSPDGLSAAESRALPALLHSLGYLEPRRQSAARASWEFHDLLFHRASRLGRAPRGFGATYRFTGRFRPLPALKRPMAGQAIELARPDLASLAAADRPLTTVLEARRSLRTPGARPLSLRQLGELLYRALGVREIDRSGPQQTMRRVYPSGGGIHELEFYVTVNRCLGLPRGIYHYHAGRHALYRLAAPRALVDSLLSDASRAWGGRYPAPQLLITAAARLPRIAWKYEGMAYRTVLVNAGAAVQTLYLVATAMGLAPCAIGNGNPRTFGLATGLDPFDETSVAELVVSSAAGGQRPATPAPGSRPPRGSRTRGRPPSSRA
jgi:SagB-type dehydrogenase family enzyme